MATTCCTPCAPRWPRSGPCGCGTRLGPAEIARERPPDLIFNLAEGVAGSGREAQAPALFEWLQ